jgi:hypothetical protein
MPCTDVTETLRITLDPQDRVIYYSLSKRTCGGSVGRPSLLKRWIRDRAASEVLAATPEEVLAALPTNSTAWQFLTLKHLYAVKAALSVLTGQSSGLPDDPCAIVSIDQGPDGIRMKSNIRVDILTSQIEECKGCDSTNRNQR